MENLWEYTMGVSYKQETKNAVRHAVIKQAIESLTNKRNNICCVRSSYVRDLYDYFREQDESHEKLEATRIDLNYIKEWERIHYNYTGVKRPSELSVCYLAGPEPKNDFDELISFGVLPQNIWAFENEQSTYLQALGELDDTSFLQPKLIKSSVERFFNNTPKKFDIVYIDACASIASSRKALQSISCLFMNQRLNSPGILISNFAGINKSTEEHKEYIEMISQYYHIINNPQTCIICNNGNMELNNQYSVTKETIMDNFDGFYGDFVTAMICNSASVTIPTIRFINSNYISQLSITNPRKDYEYSVPYVNQIRNNTLYKYLALNKVLKQDASKKNACLRLDKLISELEIPYAKFDLLSCFRKLYETRNDNKDLRPEIVEAMKFFDDEKKMYQFLDVPDKLLYFDSVINQLSYPMHYCTDKILRFSYVAKETRMFTDLIPFDECRYIYDWLPAAHQIQNAFSNPSWQYTYRFALDGLVKQRINYNNEFFYQGSVIRKDIPQFKAAVIQKRIDIN